MDSKQFDELVARLSSGPSRRDALKGVLGGALAAVGVTAVAEGKSKKGKAKAEGSLQDNERCDPPKKCRSGRNAKKCGCDRCATGHSVAFTNDKGKTVRKCACKPSGFGTDSTCTSNKAWQCCSGICKSGKCADYG